MSTKAPASFIVDHAQPLGRLDVFLREKFPGISRGTIQRLLAGGQIQVNGRPAKPTHHPRAGETISIKWPEPVASEAQAEDIPLDILHEDGDLIVLNKPPGMVVHPAAGHSGKTLVNALLHHCAGRLSGIGGVARPGIVHRLDKETSGCLVVAKTDAAHLALSAQFAGRQVTKIYEAVVCGKMPRSSGEIEAAIARHAVQRKRMAVASKGGRAARTGYRVLEQWEHAALVELNLHTGRTHQIRVHLEHLGCPVAGDPVYGRRQNARLKAATGYAPPRQLLHSARLSFIHPRTGRRMNLAAPRPPDFASAINLYGVQEKRTT